MWDVGLRLVGLWDGKAGDGGCSRVKLRRNYTMVILVRCLAGFKRTGGFGM